MAAKRGADGKTWRGFLKLLLAVLSTRVIVSGILMTFLLAYFYPTYQLKLVFFLWTRTGIAAIEAAIEAAVTYILYTNKSIDSMMKKHGI